MIDKKKRFRKKATVALIMGTVGVFLVGTLPGISGRVQKIAEKRQEQTAVTAWWGTLYPKFCFSQFPEENNEKKDDIKISFWLAKAIERW